MKVQNMGSQKSMLEMEFVFMFLLDLRLVFTSCNLVLNSSVMTRLTGLHCG